MILWCAPYRAVNGAGEQARSGIQTGTDMKAGESMLIENRIERYVTEVTSNLPVYDRGRAGREISAMIRDMIRENAGGREPGRGTDPARGGTGSVRSGGRGRSVRMVPGRGR